MDRLHLIDKRRQTLRSSMLFCGVGRVNAKQSQKTVSVKFNQR